MSALDPFLQTIQKSWHDRRLAWFLPVATLFLVLLLATGYGAHGPSIPSLVTGLLAALAVSAAWHVTTALPRVPKGRVGVVLAITSENEQQARELSADFVDQLRRLMDSDKAATLFHLVALPAPWAARCIDIDSAIRILTQARGHLMVFGSVRRRPIGGREQHVLAFEGVVRHAPIPLPRSADIGRDFAQFLPRRVRFDADGGVISFEVTSEWTEVAARYVIGLAAMFSGDLSYAEGLFLSVENRLRQTRPASALLRDLAQRLPDRFITLYSNWLNALHVQYFATRQRATLAALEDIANKLLKRSPGHYQASLQLAICHFALRRDVAAAKGALVPCKRIRDVTWRYSRAFLHAYEGNAKLAREEYADAFRGRLQDVTVPVQTEEFINIVLEEEPERVQLRFFCGLVNLRAKGDLESAVRDFTAFLQDPRSSAFPEERALAEEYLREARSHGRAGVA